jgi:hypothetical protein
LQATSNRPGPGFGHCSDATGDAAVYTSHIKPSHIIRKVILRQIAIVNYVNPF